MHRLSDVTSQDDERGESGGWGSFYIVNLCGVPSPSSCLLLEVKAISAYWLFRRPKVLRKIVKFGQSSPTYQVSSEFILEIERGTGTVRSLYIINADRNLLAGPLDVRSSCVSPSPVRITAAAYTYYLRLIKAPDYRLQSLSN